MTLLTIQLNIIFYCLVFSLLPTISVAVYHTPHHNKKLVLDNFYGKWFFNLGII